MITLEELMNMLNGLSQVNQPITAMRVVLTLLITCIIGQFIFFVYRKTFKGVLYTRNFNVGLVMIAMVTALVILPISSNILLSLGMVGALSIVRFRTAIKDPIDTVFMFWAIGVGICCGAGFYMVGIIGSLMIGLFMFLMNQVSLSGEEPYLLVVHFENGAETAVREALPAHKLKSQTVTAAGVELMLEVRAKANAASRMDKLLQIAGVKDAALISYNGDYVS
ncbi:MAG: DUF4956 domain-containing protein [bacterium]